MDSLSIIIPAHNNAAVIRRTLDSVAESLAFFHAQSPRYRDVPAELVIVDDGSADGTHDAVQHWVAGKGPCRLLRRSRPGGAACARNQGAAASTGALLLFLDGDDLFLREHVHECYRALEQSGLDFVKTGMRLADPVHPDWKRAIENSSVISLCLRRHCHFAFGGFPDYHLFLRTGDRLGRVANLSRGSCEDVYYNRLLSTLFRGCRVERDTVEYVRYPGNGYDRQYAKFCRPFGKYPEPLSDWERLRKHVNDYIFDYLLRTYKAGRTPWGEDPPQEVPAP
jgi:glycosyltransferase involved in cell wall biosynthesis